MRRDIRVHSPEAALLRSAHGEPMTSQEHGVLAGSRRSLLRMHMQQRAAGGRHSHHLESIYLRNNAANFIPMRFETTQPKASSTLATVFDDD